MSIHHGDWHHDRLNAEEYENTKGEAKLASESKGAPAPTQWMKQLEIAIRTTKFHREEFPVDCGLPREVADQIMEIIVAHCQAPAPAAPPSDDEVINGLRYIADSPAQEFGGFHPNAVLAAKSALALIEQLRASQGTPPTPDTIDDGFGSVWSAYCPDCKQKSMYVCRPGDARCAHCYDDAPIEVEALPDKCPTCGSPIRKLKLNRLTKPSYSLCTDPWHSSSATQATTDPFSKGYKHRDGGPVSDACGDGKHAECTQNLIKCHCTYRTGHTVLHAYANPVFHSSAATQKEK